MRIHSDFCALTSRHAWVAKALNENDAMDGAYARVVGHTGTSVIKATSCAATNLLFEQLWAKAKCGAPVPHNLPAVLNRFGVVAQDAERIKFTVWEVERLFESTDQTGQALARVVGRHVLAKLKPGYARQVARLTESTLEELQSALREEQEYFRGEGWKVSESIALAMALRTEGALRETFLFLREFVAQYKVGLDLLGKGNILLNMFGEPCLSDAVWSPVSNSTALSSHVKGACLAVRVPVRIQGIKVQTLARATLPLPPAELRMLMRTCKSWGLEAYAFQWASPALTAFLTSTAAEQPIWCFPQAAHRLRTGAYLKLLCT